jgi:uncharacterized protein YjbI with pentapeptide repeats
VEPKETMTWPRWLGLGDKTIWDWASLLVVPLVLAVGGYWFSMQQDARQQAIEEQRAQDTALQAYLDEMSALLITEDLRTSPKDSEARTLARSRTLTILNRLDPSRRSRVLQFLLDAELVQRIEEKNRVIDLSGANLRNVVVPADTSLSYADLTATDLSHADLSRATLTYSDLALADLSDANLSDTDLSLAKLNDTDLTDADLTGADLWQADLTDAKGVTQDTLVEQAGYVGETTMPDGHVPPPLTTGFTPGEYPSGKIPPGPPGMRIRAGEYNSDEFVPAFYFGVGEGWQTTGALEATDFIALGVDVESEHEKYVSETSDLIVTNPLYIFKARNLSERETIPAPENADKWVSWLKEHPNLETSEPKPVRIGAASGMQIDVTDVSLPEKISEIPLFLTNFNEVIVTPKRKDRFLIVDVGEETVVVNVSAPADKPNEVFSKAQKLLDTVEWKDV